MLPDPQDTIVALASAAGTGGRAIVRLSGPEAAALAGRVFRGVEPVAPGRRRCYRGEVMLPGVTAPLPADLYVWPAPRTYTGQELTEIHTLSCPPLIELLVARMLDAGARAAGPGEFTLRAFLAGKLDLPRAEAVLGVIEAGSRDQLRQALTQLAGSVTQPLAGLREDLLDLLAEVEAGLDFSEEDIRFVQQEELLDRLAKALALVTVAQKQLERRSLATRPFRVVLTGRPNAGKSSLFNALAGNAAALVSPEPGTTRDYLVHRLEIDGVAMELVDTAGTPSSPPLDKGGVAEVATDTIESQAQHLGREQLQQADLLVVCLEAGRPIDADAGTLLSQQTPPPRLAIATKCDQAAPPPDLPATSALTGAGIDSLRKLLAEKARRHALPSMAPSLSRCRHHLQACLEHLRQAHAVVLYEEPPELLALELRGALDQLGEMVGAVYTDDLLDRIFSRFCIGK